MAQVSWNLRSNTGNFYQIGLFHGDRTRHVVLYCNNRIIQLDFKVFEEKTYSFYLDDELCEVQLQPRGDNVFSYHCLLDNVAPTALNIARDKLEKKHWRLTALLAAGFVGMIVTLAVLLSTGIIKIPLDEEVLRGRLRAGAGALAAVAISEDEEGMLTYDFITQGGEIFTGTVPQEQAVDRSLILPLVRNSGFRLRYSNQDPTIFIIDWDSPAPQTRDQWIELVGQAHAERLPDVNPRQGVCQAEVAYRLLGRRGLELLYRPNLDTAAYERFIWSAEFIEQGKYCGVVRRGE